MTEYTYVDFGKLMTGKDIIEMMKFTRKTVSELLKLRAIAKIKVSQPLARAVVYPPKYFHEDFVEIIKEAVNVKEVIFIDDTDDLKNYSNLWLISKDDGSTERLNIE